MYNQGEMIVQQHRQNKRCRLLLFPVPLQGHLNPMIQLAQILHLRGFEISIVHTKYNSHNLSKHPQFTLHIIPDGLSESEVSTSDLTALFNFLNTNCAEPFSNLLREILSTYKDNTLSGIITDTSWHFTQAVADKFNLPRIVLRTTNVYSFLVFAALPLLREKGYLDKLDSNADEPVLELPPLKVKDIPMIKSSEDVYRSIEIMIQETKKSSGIIFNTFKELEEPELLKLQENFPIPIFLIGPFHESFSAASSSLLAQDRNSISWLDKQAPKSVIYVSFGSLASMDREKIHEVAWGLANSLNPFLWVIRPGLVNGLKWLEVLPNGFLEVISDRGCIVEWAPQQEVLSHSAIGGFWTHSGWNSTLESICEGITMICSPFFGDQMVNSRYVNDAWRIGINLETGWERGEIERAIKTLMTEREGQEMRQRILSLKEKVDVCLKLGGSSYQSLDNLVSFISSVRQPLG